jgi:hypothetical protein
MMQFSLKTVIAPWCVPLCVGGLICLHLVAGCETVDKFSEEMAIAPSDVTLTPGNRTVTFSVHLNTSDKPALPIEWSVSDPELGTIVSATDYTAVYRSSGHTGRNTVTARDQNGNACSATVVQTSESYSLTLTASPSTSLTSSNNTCNLTVTGGTAPYEWEVKDSSLGSLTGGDSDKVVYTSSGAAGSNVITVYDANNVSCSIGITQSSSSSSSSATPGPAG